MKNRWFFIPMLLMLVFAMVACTPKVKEAATDIKDAVKEEATDVKDAVKEEVTDVKDAVKEEGTDVKDAVDKKIINYDEILITPLMAFDIYKEEYPDKLVTRIELDKILEVGSYIYRVEGHNEKIGDVEVVAKEININPINGDVSDPDVKLDLHLKNHAEITKSNVEKIQALIDKSLIDAGKGSSVSQWKLRWDWDNKILKFELGVDLPGFGDVDYTYNIETDELIDRD